MSRVPVATQDFLRTEMAIHAGQGGSAGVEATIRAGHDSTATKFSDLGSSRRKPLEQCHADQGSLHNQLPKSRDHRVHMDMAFPSSRANRQMMQRAAPITDSYPDRRSPKSCNGTTQLTIFYAGTVNAYDIPADKAKAIMALASSGNNIRNPQMMRDSVNRGHHRASPGNSVGSTSTSPMKEMAK